MNKTIDVVVKYFYPVTAGIETNVLETYSRLVDKGWRVTIHTSNDTLEKKDILPLLETYKGLTIRRYRSGFLNFDPQISYGKTGLICLHNFDLFPHARIFVAMWIRRVFHKKTPRLFLTPHGGFTPEWPTFPILIRLLKQVYHRTLGLWMITHLADGVRAVSDWEYRQLVYKGVPKKLVKTISNGLEDDAFSTNDIMPSDVAIRIVKKNTPYIIDVGRISPIKHYETAIAALKAMNHDCRFLIMGPVQDDEYKQRLLMYANSLGVSNRLRFIGVHRGADKYYLLRNASLMVHLASWESFGNVVHEAMSQGIICVVSMDTGVADRIEPGISGYLSGKDDAQRIAELADRSIDPRDQEFSAIRKKLKHTRWHSWKDTAQEMNKAYLKLI